MMKTQAITKYIAELDKNTSYEGKYKIKYALASTLPDTAFLKFIEDGDRDGSVQVFPNSFRGGITIDIHRVCFNVKIPTVFLIVFP